VANSLKRSHVFAVALAACIGLMIVLTATTQVRATSKEPGTASKISFTAAETAIIKSQGPWPIPVPDDAGNELSGLAWAESLGETLFHSTIFSGNESLSCASCHQADKGFTDGAVVGIGAQQHVRNTQTLWNVGLQRWFGWDGGADSLWAATIRPMLSDIEMAGDLNVIATRLRENDSIATTLSKGLSASQSPSIITNEKSGGIDQLDNQELLVIAAKTIAAYMAGRSLPQLDR